MTTKVVELGAIIGAGLIGFGLASALLDRSKTKTVVDGDTYYDAEGDSRNRFSDYGRRDREGSITTSMPLNLGGRRLTKRKRKRKINKK